jgi:hypothetical protein
VRRRGSHIFQTIVSQIAVKLSALRAGRPLTPRKILGTHFFQRLSRPQGHSAAGRIKTTEKSDDFNGNRTHDLPACNMVHADMLLQCKGTVQANNGRPIFIHSKLVYVR